MPTRGQKNTKQALARKKVKKTRVPALLRGSSSDAENAVMQDETTPYRVITLLKPARKFTTVDLFCGAGGITEGFRRAGFACQYANDINPWAIETFRANHPGTHADNRPIEQVDAAALCRELNLQPGELDVIVGGPPGQGFSINAPEGFLTDPRNSLFKHYIQFLDEFEPKNFRGEN